MPAKIDLTGQQFGRLTVIKEQKERKNNNIIWLCQCQCGRKASVKGIYLRASETRSCGCYPRDVLIQRNTIHGDAGKNKSKLYETWKGTRKRCSNKNCKDYGNYGGRGIKVCKIWHDFRAFKEWALASGWQEGLELDRIDNNGDYRYPFHEQRFQTFCFFADVGM